MTDLLTAERERNMRREHGRKHPHGLMRSGLVCDVCLLLEALTDERETAAARLPYTPRCTTNTVRGYRCARQIGHKGAHSHPRDHEVPR